MNPPVLHKLTGVHITLVYENGDSHTWSAALGGAPTGYIQDTIDNAIDEALLAAGYINQSRWQKREKLRKFKDQNGGEG